MTNTKFMHLGPVSVRVSTLRNLKVTGSKMLQISRDVFKGEVIGIHLFIEDEVVNDSNELLSDYAKISALPDDHEVVLQGGLWERT